MLNLFEILMISFVLQPVCGFVTGCWRYWWKGEPMMAADFLQLFAVSLGLGMAPFVLVGFLGEESLPGVIPQLLFLVISEVLAFFGLRVARPICRLIALVRGLDKSSTAVIESISRGAH